MSSNDNTGSDVSMDDTTDNFDQFQQMIQLCQKNIVLFPKEYVKDMNTMYNSCNDKQKNSKKLCNLIHKGIQHISAKNKKSFDYAADVYNELLQLSKKDSVSSQNENCIASTSSTTELNNGDPMSSEIFKSLIEKCYQNPNYPNSNIDKIDKLYNSLPSEFVDSKYFIRLLKEADQIIWPDSSSSFYIHIEHVYEQLLQFHSKMKVQDRKISIENKEINQKKFKKLAELEKALHITRKKIRILETSEMDIQIDDDYGPESVYILKDKYKKIIVEIYKRMCKLEGEPDFLGKPPFRFRDTNNPLVNKVIETFYNVNQEFPDYFEIYTLLKFLNEKKRLNWTTHQLQNISQNAFLMLGKRLKGNRLKEYFGHLSTFATEEDPAEKSRELKNKLEKSKKKLLADLTMVRKKFINKQDYAEEIEGSDLANSDCEISSEDELMKKNINKKSILKALLTKRKKELTYNSENDKSPKKSKKTVYIESLDLTPCAHTVDKLNLIEEKSNIDKTAKDTVDIGDDSIDMTDKTIDVDAGIIPNNTSTIVLENINNNISIEEGSISGTKGDGTLVIDEHIKDTANDKLVSKNPPENKIQSAKTKDNKRIITKTVDNISNDPIVTEPIVVIHESKDSAIELNELDDSDVQIISCDTPRVPIQKKKSLTMNFEQKYNFPPIAVDGHNFGNNQNSNNVNCLVMNNVRPSRPMNTRRDNYNRMQPQQQPNRRMQSSIQRNMAQTASHFSQRYPNAFNQHRHFLNNRSSIQQSVTITTTTVQQVHSVTISRHSISQSNYHECEDEFYHSD